MGGWKGEKGGRAEKDDGWVEELRVEMGGRKDRSARACSSVSAAPCVPGRALQHLCLHSRPNCLSMLAAAVAVAAATK